MTTTPTLWRAAQQANTSDAAFIGDDQRGIGLIGLPKGNFLALWEDNSNITDGKPGDDIIGRIFDPLGNGIGNEFRVNTHFADDEGKLTAAALPNGRFVVVYEDTNANGTSIRFVVREPTGEFVGSGTIAEDTNGFARGQPSVTVAADGSFLVAFQQDVSGGPGPAEVRVMRVGTGLAVGPQLRAVPSASGESDAGVRTDAAVLTNGKLVTVGTLIDGAPENASVLVFTMRNTDGSSFGFNRVPAVGNTDTNREDDLAPAIAALAGGGFVVAWQNTDETDTDIQFQRFTAAGAETGNIGSVHGGGTDNNRRPEVVGLADGGFVIVYVDTGQIKLQRYSASGGEVGSEVSVSPPGGADRPTITLTDDGRLLVGWQRTIGQVDDDVHFAIFDPRDNVINGDDTNNIITSRINGATVNGKGGKDTLLGQDAGDTLTGGDNDDTLFGGGGNDILIGGAEIDTLKGEGGSDTVRIFNDERGDIIDGGTDSGGDDVDRLDLSGLTTRKAIVDLADETYRIRNADGSAFLGGNVFALRNMEAVSGTQLDDVITGNSRVNVLNGNNGDDTLLGGNATDTVNGGAGDDTIRVLENERGDHTNGGVLGRGRAGSNTDTLDLSAITSRLAVVDLGVEYTIRNADNSVFGDVNTLINIDNVLGTRLGDVITGNNGVNVLSGNEGGDTIFGDDGAGGVDTLNGGRGDDILAGGGGTDNVNGDQNDDAFRVFDGEFGDNIDGGADTDLLDLENISLRHASVDLVNETYEIRNDNGGLFGIACNLIDVENVAGTQQSDSIVGDGRRNVLEGNGGRDMLDGGGNNDTLLGGAGNDKYFVDSRGDVVDETDGTGNRDEIISSVSFSLADTAHVKGNLERLTLAGNAVRATGNGDTNVLTGNGLDNILDGGGSTDTMRGGGGNDTYVFDDLGDIADERGGDGDEDTIESSVNLSLADTAHVKGAVERLTLTGGAITATGNGDANILRGNGLGNTLDGDGAGDTMIGGGGSDTYLVNSADDVVDETNGSGDDTVSSGIDFSLAETTQVKGVVERLTLTGNATTGTGNGEANTLTGNGLANTLDGAGGGDTMIGGDGADTYLVNNADDIVDETNSGGVDIVSSNISFSLDDAVRVLGTVENLTLTGSADRNGTGNAAANIIIGNGGDNTINGQAGNDTLTGAGGNDRFLFNTALDAPTNSDRITDFAVNVDEIALDNDIFLGIGTMTPGRFHIGSAANAPGRRIIYNEDNGNLFYDADGNGAIARVRFAILDPNLALDSQDFVLVG